MPTVCTGTHLVGVAWAACPRAHRTGTRFRPAAPTCPTFPAEFAVGDAVVGVALYGSFAVALRCALAGDTGRCVMREDAARHKKAE